MIPKCRARRDFTRPDGMGTYTKGYVFERMPALLRGEWIRLGFVELIGEDAAERKAEAKKKRGRNNKGQFASTQPIARTG